MTPKTSPDFPYPATNYQEDYQHNPFSLVWDTMHWGHATSTDLVHWTQRPIALDPHVHPGDLWSGGGVVDTGNTSGLKNADDDPIIVFSGTNGVTVFYSLDGGTTFTTYADGKKVATPGGTSRPELATLRESTQTWEGLTVENGVRQLPARTGYELEAIVDVREASKFSLRVGREVVYNADQQTLDGATLRTIDGKIKLHLLIDRGQLDVFGNDGAVYQSYNNPPAEPELVAEGRVHLDTLTIHHLSSIWR